MTFDYAKARETMVEQQIRPWEVLDPRVLEAMTEIRREDLGVQEGGGVVPQELALRGPPLGRLHGAEVEPREDHDAAEDDRREGAGDRRIRQRAEEGADPGVALGDVLRRRGALRGTICVVW